VIRTRKTTRGVRYDVRLRDPDGRVYNRTFATKKAAEAFERSERTDRGRGVWVDPRRADATFADWAVQWRDANPAKRPKTRVDDELIIRLHIDPVLGRRPIGAITPLDVQRLVNSWAERPRRPYAGATPCSGPSATPP